MKTILITGATDGIGLATARALAGQGHNLVLHGRSADKLAAAQEAVGTNSGFLADLSELGQVIRLARDVHQQIGVLDVLINNAGVLGLSDPVTSQGLDARFVVNALAPMLLTRELKGSLGPEARVVNISSAAQAPVDLALLRGEVRAKDDMAAYAQSKLALTMWTIEAAAQHPNGPLYVAVNPGSLLASKMVRDGFGIAGNDISIGVASLSAAALSEEFAGASGKYYDTDAGGFGPPHADALDPAKRSEVVQAMAALLPQAESDGK